MADRTEQPQASFDDHHIDDADLLALLREEGERKAVVSDVRAKAREAEEEPLQAAGQVTERVDVHLTGLNLEDGITYRCGPFEIVPESRGATPVSFKRKPKRVFHRKMVEAD